MKIYAIDFGDANTRVVTLDTTDKPPRPQPLQNPAIGSSYGDGPPVLIPTCLMQSDSGPAVIGKPARTSTGHVSNLKTHLADGDETFVELTAEFFKGLFQQLPIPFADAAVRTVFTRPSFEDEDAVHDYLQRLGAALGKVIPDYERLVADGHILFCDEALASAVGYRVYQQSKVGKKGVLCLDVGSYTADATFFSTDDYAQVQRGQPGEIRRASRRRCAGRQIDDWIELDLAGAEISAAPADCETLKLALSTGTADLGDAGLPEALTARFPTYKILNDVLRNQDFYGQLAELCCAVLPEDARTEPAAFKQIEFLFTGGTSLLPDFGKEVHAALWTRLFEREAQRGERLRTAKARCYRPLDACVTGALWWQWLRLGERYIPVLDRGYGFRIYSRPDPANGLVPENICFLAQDEELEQFEPCSYLLLPAHDDQTEFRVEFVALSGGMEDDLPAVGFVEGELKGRDQIKLDLRLEPPDRLVVLIDDEPVEPVYLEGHRDG